MDKEQEKRKGGRPPGATSKIKLAIAELIQPDALKIYRKLWELANTTKDDAIKLGCYKEMLDRGFGKPFQALAVGIDGGAGPPVIFVSTGVPRRDDSLEPHCSLPLTIEGKP